MHVIDVAEHYDRRKLKSPELEAVWRGVRPLMPKARRFIFDREASAFVGAFIRDFGPTLLENLQFAIPPFETVYIEYRLDALLNAIGQRKPEWGPAVDEGIGHIIYDNSVVTFIQDERGNASLYPVAVQLHTETYSRGQFSDDLEDNKLKKLTYTLGSTTNDVKLTSMDTMKQWLHHIDIFTGRAFRLMLRDDSMRTAGNGTVRNLVALLLILNRQRDHGVEFTKVPAKGVLYKGKRRVYMAHSLVTLTTEDYGRITKSFAAGGRHESPRRHQVRGFFRHYRKTKGCEHHYIEDDIRPRHWTCQHCGQVRVWVDSFERGDAGKGYVTKEYVVTDPT